MNEPIPLAGYNCPCKHMSGVSVDIGATIKQFVAANPIVVIGLAGAAAYFIYSLLKK